MSCENWNKEEHFVNNTIEIYGYDGHVVERYEIDYCPFCGCKVDKEGCTREDDKQ